MIKDVILISDSITLLYYKHQLIESLHAVYSRLQTLTYLVVIYIGYYSVIDSLQWDVGSPLKLDFEEANTLMGPNGHRFGLIYHDDTGYEGWIDSRFTLVHKGILVMMQGWT